jgi:isopenicillin N synthase-like dioxygenase
MILSIAWEETDRAFCVDYGTLTLVFQDNVGGLEVENPHTKHFRPVKPIVCRILHLDKCHGPSQSSFFEPGTIVVNAGDLLARWSNDILRSTVHRVVAPPTESGIKDEDEVIPFRQSIAFFCNPNEGAKISCLPNCHWPGNEEKYTPITTTDYIVGRLAETYD